jgi:hypothetical protein
VYLAEHPQSCRSSCSTGSSACVSRSSTSQQGAGIDLLQERRTAVISAAVTGQIDVRDFVEEKEKAA